MAVKRKWRVGWRIKGLPRKLEGWKRTGNGWKEVKEHCSDDKKKKEKKVLRNYESLEREMD